MQIGALIGLVARRHFALSRFYFRRFRTSSMVCDSVIATVFSDLDCDERPELLDGRLSRGVHRQHEQSTGGDDGQIASRCERFT